MKIALFTDSYLPTTDGVVRSILDFRRGLSAKGHRMLVFAPDAPGAKKEEGVRRFHAVPFPPYPQYRAAVFPHVPSSVAAKEKIDIVHCKGMVNMGLSAVAFAKAANLPCMASLETMIPDGMHYLFPLPAMQKVGRRMAWAYLKWFYSNFDLVTSPSKHTQAILKSHGIESLVLPSPVDTEKFRPNQNGKKIKKALGLEGKRVVASVGRVVREKNYSFLVKAAKNLAGADVVFLIVGAGPYLEQLKREIAIAGLEKMFCFTGFVPEEKLVDYYNAADAFVFVSRFETQGLTLLEAFACGKSACVIDGTPMAELVEEGKNGFAFGSRPQDCAEKILLALKGGKGMARAARKTALEYSVEKCTARLISCYKKLL